MHDLLGYGLGMELLALGERPEGSKMFSFEVDLI
jgi:hypothetical protein